jgi:hypothetical protein
MVNEPKGFYNDSHKLLERDEPRCTKRGIVIYKGKGDHWYLEFPDGTGRIGSVTAIKLMTLIYHLKETNGNIDKSRKELGW